MNQKEKNTAEKIRARYEEKQPTTLDALRRLDGRVKRPATVLAYTLGGLSAVVMGAGMSLIMTDIGSHLSISAPFVPGLMIGLVGLAGALVNYPLYRLVLGRRQKKYRAEILALGDRVAEETEA